MDLKISFTFSCFICIVSFIIVQSWRRDIRTDSINNNHIDPRSSDSNNNNKQYKIRDPRKIIYTKEFTSGIETSDDSSGSESNQINSDESNEEFPIQNTMTTRGLDFRKAALDTMNFYRDEHEAEPLKSDPRLDQNAQTHAEYLALKDRLEHSCQEQTCRYGENLSYSASNNINWADAVRDDINRWYNENKFYNYKNPQYDSKTGHFTQLIWKSSKKVGIGMAKSLKTGRLYLVVQFIPQGNIRNQFSINVLPPQ